MINLTPTKIEPCVRICNFFDVDPESSSGWRILADYELIFVLKGHFRYTTDERTWYLGDSEMLCIPPRVKHYFAHIRGETTISCIHFDLIRNSSGVSSNYFPDPKPKTVTKITEPEFLKALFVEMNSTFNRFSPNKDYLLSNMFKTIWLKLSEYWQAQGTPEISLKVEQMMDYLRKRVFSKAPRHELGQKFGYTPEYVNYLFKKELGITPTQFVNREKVLVAFDLLKNEGLSVREVSERLGFCDQYHFSKLFKKVIGLNPSYFKRK